ncbi:MAG: 4Fe-4S binding protein [Promethearchaeota archaeon]
MEMNHENDRNDKQDKHDKGIGEKSYPRIGVFVCHCGHNISDTVDVVKVVESVKNLPNVVEALDYSYMCSKPGLVLIKKAIREKKINRTVVAACSLAQHGPTFSGVLDEEGLNKNFHFQCNIREGCSWVIPKSKKKDATKKAIKLVTAAINRARKLEAIETKQIPTTKAVLVIGGGIAGLRATMDIVNLGVPVTLVERQSSVGGHMVQLYKTFPTNECPQCCISPLINGVANHPDVDLMTYSFVSNVEGSLGKFKVEITTKARYVNDKCTSCGDCSLHCPVEVPSEWDCKLTKRKAIYKLYPQAVPSIYVIDKKSCINCRLCEKVCTVGAIDFSMKKKKKEIQVGSIVLATGYEEYNPSEIEAYHYNQPGYENVITQLQFERMLSSGLSDANIYRPSNGKLPKRIVMIQCVGSRNEQVGNAYCTGVCCMFALKNAQMIKDFSPEIEVIICYIDIRTPGLYYEEYYLQTQKKGVKFIRGRPSEIERDPISGDLHVYVEDTFTMTPMDLQADLIILSAAMVPPKGIGILGSKLQVLRSKEGFVKEYHLKMQPTKSSREGIFIAGSIQGPKDITQTVAQAGSAAILAATPLVQGYIEKEMVIPVFQRDLCVLCGLCISICPNSALSIENDKIILNEVACNACGLCQPSCPTGAIQMKNTREDQLRDEIRGIVKNV